MNSSWCSPSPQLQRRNRAIGLSEPLAVRFADKPPGASRAPLCSVPRGGTFAVAIHQPVNLRTYCNFANSALACSRMGMSGSASFQRVKKSL
jgi:hypothetical protein